eukprot:g6201.t1
MSPVNLCRQGTCVSFLVLFVALICLSAVRAQFTCDTSRYLHDAGYTGITQEICEEEGYCWDESVPEGKPWCFIPNGGYQYCYDYAPRSDCGFYGIDSYTCIERGCCYAPYGDGPWCFFPNANY